MTDFTQLGFTQKTASFLQKIAVGESLAAAHALAQVPHLHEGIDPILDPQQADYIYNKQLLNARDSVLADTGMPLRHAGIGAGVGALAGYLGGKGIESLLAVKGPSRIPGLSQIAAGGLGAIVGHEHGSQHRRAAERLQDPRELAKYIEAHRQELDTIQPVY